MAHARVSMVTGEAAQRAIDEVDLPKALPPGVFHVLLHHPRLSRALGDYVIVVLQDSRLEFRTQKLVILRVAWVTCSAYEWGQHSRHALTMGFSNADLLGVRDWETYADFSPLERSMLAATDEMLATGGISDATWAECANRLDEAQLVDLVTTITLYDMVARMIEGLRIPLDADLVAWAPDGEAPKAMRA